MKLLISLMLVCLAFAQSTIEMASTPAKENGVKFNLLTTLDGGEDGFYDRVTADISPDGRIVVGDIGNKQVQVYDSKFNLVHAFGDEGSGPGEIDRIGTVKATDDRIYVNTYTRLIIFDYKGNYFTDVSLMENGSSELLFFNGEIHLTYERGKYRRIVYDKDGKKVREQKNESYVEKKAQGGNRFVVRISGGSGKLVSYKDGYVSSTKGEYGIEIKDKNLDVQKVLKRSFTRVPYNFDNFKMSFKMEGASKKAQAEMQKKMAAQMRSQLGKYRDDIERIVGIHENYIFATVSGGEEGKVLMDVISPDFKYYTQIEIEAENVLSAKISHGKLLLCQKSEEDGPFINVYDIAMN